MQRLESSERLKMLEFVRASLGHREVYVCQSNELYFKERFSQSSRALILLIAIAPFACLLLYWSHITNSLGKAFGLLEFPAT